MEFIIQRVVREMKRNSVEISSLFLVYTVGAKYSIPQSGSDRDGQCVSVTVSVYQSRASFPLYLILLELENAAENHCSHHPSNSGNTCLAYSQPPHLRNGGHGSLVQRAAQTAGKASPNSSRTLERMCEGLFPVRWAEGWQLGRINCNYLFISEI